MNSLLERVNEQSKTIATDSYSMSVGELLAMYKEGELILRPEFQIRTALGLFKRSLEEAALNKVYLKATTENIG